MWCDSWQLLFYVCANNFYIHLKAFVSKYSLSIISDEMTQNHCILPWLSNQSLFGAECHTQHLHGILIHRRSFLMFRTFHNIPNRANSQIIFYISFFPILWLAMKVIVQLIIYFFRFQWVLNKSIPFKKYYTYQKLFFSFNDRNISH